MYICRHCGQISHNENINYCSNIKCKYYGYNDNGANECESEKAVSYAEKRNMRGESYYPEKKEMPYREAPMKEMYGKEMPMRQMKAAKMAEFSEQMYPCTTCYEKKEPPMYKEKEHTYKEMSREDISKEKEHMHTEYMRKEKKHMSLDMTYTCGMLGFATVPMQQFEEIYPVHEALKAGTVFPALNMPYDKKIIRRG